MKKLLVVRPHSFVDVITNSSTELFVCQGDKSAEMVREILEEKWKAFKELYGYREELSKILEVKVWGEKNAKKDIARMSSNDMEWVKDYGVKVKDGDICIIGTEDNSIPWEFFDVIEKFFDAKGYHLG